MKATIRQKLARSKQRMQKRLEKGRLDNCERPVLTASPIRYEIGGRTRAVAAGGIGAIHQMVKHLELDQEIDRYLHLLKVHAPYHESDHVLSIAYNFLAGGTCLEHLEAIRTDEVFLDALGARRLPDPTTAGDFCRRFTPWDTFVLQEVFNRTRIKVWRQQPEAFFAEAVIDGDGTLVETCGECKQGMEINHEGKWGYHPLVISLANTGEPLYVINRSGNRPSHEHAALFFTRAVALCREAGFRRVVLRGDTDFSQTEHLDAWDADGVKFVFGIDAMRNLVERAENLPEQAWTKLPRPERYRVKTQPRARPEKVKARIVQERNFTNLRLQGEAVAEFRYRPTACRKEYRIVVVRKDLQISGGQRKLFENEQRYFFYITNEWERTRASGREGERALQSGERDRADEERRAGAGGAGGQPGEQRSLHGDGDAGVVAEGLDGAVVARRGALEGAARSREAEAAQDGLRHVPSRVDEHAGADRSHEPAPCLSPALVESVAARLLPPPRSTAAPVAVLTAPCRSRSPDAPVRRHAPPQKALPHARPAIRTTRFGLADPLEICARQTVRQSQKSLRAYACLRTSDDDAWAPRCSGSFGRVHPFPAHRPLDLGDDLRVVLKSMTTAGPRGPRSP